MSTVFLSYRHESDAHCAQVRDLGVRLQGSGVEVILDQFCEEENSGAPNDGWAKWSADQVKEAERILIIASSGWFECFDGTAEPGTGLGAAYEARLIFNQLYNAGLSTSTHRVVVFDDDLRRADIPLDLQDVGRFRPLQGHDKFSQMVSWLQPAPAVASIAPGDVVWPDPIDFEPDIANRREHEWPAFLGAVHGRSERRILFYEGISNRGKTTLLLEMHRYAQEAGIACCHIDFKGGERTLAEILQEIDLEVGGALPSFAESGGNDPVKLRKDLSALSQPVLLIFDAFEQARLSKDIERWLQQQLLRAVPRSPGLCVVIGGKSAPESEGMVWQPYSSHFELLPIDSADDWRPWMERQNLDLTGDQLKTLLLATDGDPGQMCSMIRTLSGKLNSNTGDV